MKCLEGKVHICSGLSVVQQKQTGRGCQMIAVGESDGSLCIPATSLYVGQFSK